MSLATVALIEILMYANGDGSRYVERAYRVNDNSVDWVLCI